MEPSDDLEQRISGIAALDQPTRRDLYQLLAERGDWVSRDDAASALDVPRSVAAFHLDKLAAAGAVDVTYERTSGRTGPGAGRPSKLYRRSQGELAASVPERRYDLAGSLLASAVAESTRTGVAIGDCLSATAHAAGRALGEEAMAARGPRKSASGRREAIRDVLAEHGYEPQSVAGAEIALANCPFHRLAEQHRSLVCGMNLDFLAGLLEVMGPAGDLNARLAPEPGYCCVRIAAS